MDDKEANKITVCTFQEQLELQFGLYCGQVEDGKPHGKGRVTFNPDDIGGRQTFEGQ